MMANTRQFIRPRDQEHWLSLREPDITSTDVAALYGLSPYLTEYELYQAKANGLRLPFQSNSRIQAGNDVEAYAAQKVAADLGMEARPYKEYIRLPDERIGSSFDWILNDEIILEIKSMDWVKFKALEEDCLPPHIEVQAQHQMLVSGKRECKVAVWTGIYDYTLYDRQADDDMHAAMIKRIAKFWADVEAGNAPAIDPYRDGKILELVYRDQKEDMLDLGGREDVDAMVTQYKHHKAEASHHEQEARAIKVKLHELLADKKGGFTDNYRVSAGYVKDSPGTLVTEEMVGTYINQRRGYRRLDIKEIK